MVFFLYGPNTFFSQRKLKEIIEKYRSKHKSGFNLVKIESTEEGFEITKDSIETVSMFSGKKLIIIENLFSSNKNIQNKFQEYFEKINIFEKEEISVVIFENREIDKRNKLFKLLIKKSFKKQEFLDIPPFKIRKFIEEETKILEGKISHSAIDELILFFGNNLWEIENELKKLIIYKNGETIEKKDIENVCTANVDLNIFKTIEAISKKNKKEALKLISEHFEKGENEIKILSMIVYQFRVLLKIKSLLDEKKSFFQIQKISRLHPFVIKKTLPIAKNFSQEDLKNIYKKILETDFSIKTGKVEPKLGIEILVNSL